MAKINQVLLGQLRKKLGLGQDRVYKLIQQKVADTGLERHLAAMVLASEHGISLAKYATREDLVVIREANLLRRGSMPATSSVPAVQKVLKPTSSATVYVHPSRIRQLRAIPPADFDLSRLVELCEELNECYANDCPLAVAMLTRAIVDHVPPIFGYQNFDQFAADHRAGSKEGKSFKASMDHLGKSLKSIADAHLHVQIMNREVIPNLTQVNFSQDLDVLLAEIVRFLKK
jgi:hypothetical protein